MAQKDNWRKHIREVKIQIHLKGLIISTFLINCKKKREEGGREEREGERRKRQEEKERSKLFFKQFPVDVWKKPTQYCKTIIPIKINKSILKIVKKKKRNQRKIKIKSKNREQLPLWSSG